jgi:hypothetical protein
MKDEKQSKRIKTAGYSHAKADARKDKRRAEAKARNAAYAARPVDETLEVLDKWDLGEARRERAKLYPRLFNVEVVPNKKKGVTP